MTTPTNKERLDRMIADCYDQQPPAKGSATLLEKLRALWTACEGELGNEQETGIYNALEALEKDE